HPLAPESVANPSVAVDGVWEQLIHNGAAWAELERGAYPRSERGRDPQMARRDARRRGDEALALTYAMACVDEDLPRAGMAPTATFDADAASGLRGATRWVVFCGHSPCRPPADTRCIRHELVPLIPDDLPDQLPLHHRRPLPNVPMKNESQFGWGGPY
nr:hypothetical protein [Actinomycetota bacterium]